MWFSKLKNTLRAKDLDNSLAENIGSLGFDPHMKVVDKIIFLIYLSSFKAANVYEDKLAFDLVCFLLDSTHYWYWHFLKCN